MINFLSPLTLLPLAELLGFIFIGGSIGFFATLLWLFFAASAGFYLLTMSGTMAMSRAAAGDDDVFGTESIFASLCTLIAALLLIFPGFISDFIAVPLLVPALRQWLFRRTQKSPDHVFRRSYRSFSQMRRTQQGTSSTTNTTVIEGEYKRVDDNEKLP